MGTQSARKAGRPPQQDRSRDTHRAILVAAEELMADRPLDKIPISEIAREAGVSVGNFYNRFADKTELLQAMLDEYEQERLVYLSEAFALEKWRDMDLQERCDGIVVLLIDFFQSRKALIRSFVMYYRTHPAAPAIASGLREITRLGSAILIEIMPADKDAGYRANLGLQTVLALCREFILFGSEPTKRPLKLSHQKLARHLQSVLFECVQR